MGILSVMLDIIEDLPKLRLLSHESRENLETFFIGVSHSLLAQHRHVAGEG